MKYGAEKILKYGTERKFTWYENIVFLINLKSFQGPPGRVTQTITARFYCRTVITALLLATVSVPNKNWVCTVDVMFVLTLWHSSSTDISSHAAAFEVSRVIAGHDLYLITGEVVQVGDDR